MASGLITSWQQVEREKVEAVTDFIFLGSKITVDGNCSHEIKRCLPLRSILKHAVYDDPKQHIEKQRHNLDDNGSYSQSYGFICCNVQM